VKVVAMDSSDDFDAWLQRKGVVARSVVVGDVEVIEEVTHPLLLAANYFRNRMFEASRALLPEERAGLLMGLVIGDDRFTGEEIRDDFRASGLSHLTAVSGANLAVVLAALVAVLTALRTPRRVQIFCGLAVIILFAAITRWEPSVLRASVMATLALAAFLFGRIPNPLHALGLAFGGLLAYDPMMLWSIGFQLSFAATAGILVLRKPLLRRMPSLPALVVEPVAIGVAAQVAVFPLIAVHFDRISIAAVPANLAAVGLVPPVTILGLVAGVVAMFSTWLAGPLVWWAGHFVAALAWIARVFGRSEAAELPVPNFGVAEALASYLLIAAMWLLLAGYPRPARWPAAVAVVLITGAGVLPAVGHGPPDGLRVTFFDVGAGDATLIESSQGARILIDGGPDPFQVAATLRRWGFERLDLVVATHLHADHIAGLEAVMEKMEVGAAVHPGVSVPDVNWMGAAADWDPVGDGHVLRVGDLELQVLGPSRDLRYATASALQIDPDDGTALNDASVVMRVNWGRLCLLFPADVEEQGQQDLLDRRREDLRCSVLQAPHHGSGRLLPDFVEAVDPTWVTVSVGPNRHGHPTDKALDMFRSAGARVLRTDRRSDVVLELTDWGEVRVR
ncbi:MAG: ComEC/Rec2 family competence protein, partial [Actinobacteria bacterium]|nr:ComEC/Rec2 family competence protein [Actinomycetota bacterium]